jgi:hypothetical protein
MKITARLSITGSLEGILDATARFSTPVELDETARTVTIDDQDGDAGNALTVAFRLQQANEIY